VKAPPLPHARPSSDSLVGFTLVECLLLGAVLLCVDLAPGAPSPAPLAYALFAGGGLLLLRHAWRALS